MKELLDNIKKIFSKKLTLAVVLVIVAALAIVGVALQKNKKQIENRTEK